MQDALGNCSSTVRTIVEKWKQLILTGSNSAVEGAVSGLHCLYVPYQMLISQSNFHIPVNYRQLDMLCFLACCKFTNQNQYALHIRSYHYIIIYIYITNATSEMCALIACHYYVSFYVHTGLLLIPHLSSLCVRRYSSC